MPVLFFVFAASGASADRSIARLRHDRTLFPVISEGHYGFISREGKLVIPPSFDETTGFAEGLAAVKKNGKWGYIDTTGSVVIEIKYSTYANNEFSEGLAAINEGPNSNGRWGFVDTEGVVVIPPVYEWVGPFSEGLAFVVSEGKRGFINTQGDLVIDTIFELAQCFAQGLAPARPAGGKWGYINRDGVFVIRPQFDSASPFNEGFALVEKTGAEYCVDRSGQLRFENRAGFFFEGLAAVRQGDHGEGRWGFIDANGKFVIEPVFEDAQRFSEGMAAIKQNGKWGFIWKDGTAAISPAYDAVGDFEGGLAAVSLGGKAEILFPFGAKGYADRNALLGYIDQKGNYVWRPRN